MRLQSLVFFLGTSGRGNIAVSTNTAGGASTWTVVPIDESLTQCGTSIAQPMQCTGFIDGVACLSAAHCVKIDDHGVVSVSAGPATLASSWRTIPIQTRDSPGYDPLQTLACPSTTACFAGDFVGHLAILSHPTMPPAAWHGSLFEDDLPYGGGLCEISCASAQRCVGVFGSQLLTSVHASRSVRDWAPVDVGAHEGGSFMQRLCRNVLGCLVLDGTGRAYTSQKLTSAKAWRRWRVPAATNVTDLTCAGTAFCVAPTTSDRAIVAIRTPPRR